MPEREDSVLQKSALCERAHSCKTAQKREDNEQGVSRVNLFLL